jgi:hypothetical protein
VKLRRSTLLCAVCLATAAPAAHAQPYQIYGAGAASCGTWTDARKEGGARADALEAWVEGFLTGTNALLAVKDEGPDVAASTDMSGILKWLDRYCADHPLDRITAASMALIAELDKRKPPPAKEP